MKSPTMTLHRILLLVPAVSLSLFWAAEACAGCEKDNDCKGDRICEAGRCAAPGGSGVSTGAGPGVEPGTWTSESGMPPPPAAPPLCAADTDCKGEQVCVEGECKAPGVASPGKAAPAKGPTLSTVKARFGPKQLKTLRLSGCPLDETSARMADRLVDRGFSEVDFLAACKEDRALRAAHPLVSAYPRGMVETLAAASKLGLGRSRRLELVRLRHGQGRPLTDAYNRTMVGGHVQEVVGWSLTGGGAAAVLAGLILIPVAADHVVDQGPGIDLDEDGYGVASIILLASGTALLVAGVPALVVGRQKQEGWLRPGTLESADAKTLRKRGKRSGTSWMLLPTVGRSSAGLGLTGVF